MKATTVALTIAGVATLGTVGYFASRHMQCQGLEDDYLNSVSAMRDATVSTGILKETDAEKSLEIIRDQQMKVAEQTMRSLYAQCGNRAAETAARKGTELLLP